MHNFNILLVVHVQVCMLNGPEGLKGKEHTTVRYLNDMTDDTLRVQCYKYVEFSFISMC